MKKGSCKINGLIMLGLQGVSTKSIVYGINEGYRS